LKNPEKKTKKKKKKTITVSTKTSCSTVFFNIDNKKKCFTVTCETGVMAAENSD